MATINVYNQSMNHLYFRQHDPQRKKRNKRTVHTDKKAQHTQTNKQK